MPQQHSDTAEMWLELNKEQIVAAETFTDTAVTFKRWPKHGVWIGLAINIAGVFSYFFYFAQFPDLRDFPIVNLPLVLVGMLLTGAGCLTVFKQGGGAWGKSLASLAFLMTLAFTGCFNFYVFSYSYQLPEASGVPQVKATAPDFTLPDQNGAQVSLSDYQGKKLVLVFYRGYW